jgi:hypothetical protein
MHEAGLWARSLYPASAALRRSASLPVGGLVVETLRMAGCSTTSATGRSPTSSTTTCWRVSRPRPTPRRRGKRLTHEDLSQLIIEESSGRCIRGCGGAGRDPERDAFGRRRGDRPGLGLVPVAKPALADRPMPRWVRWLQPLLSGVFTVDNLDYVRRDAYLTGVAVGPVDVERLRRYAFISDAGLTLYEPGWRASRCS